ncbi:ribonuclease H-like domain-containing protein [Tanacetum coccineum]|uniref:Ribonuclease H-like domain-containing protein n=1 Tax=Tanacetum coccineum TaxID=301880 RepID=A0ABQ5FHY4_9ASTR
MSQPANDDFSQHLSDDEASYHEDASENGTATNKPKQQQQQQQLIPTTTTISNIKLPILKKEEYDIWAMEMEHYLEYIDNDVWKVIQEWNSKKRSQKEKIRKKEGDDRFQQLLSQLEAYGAKVSTEDANHKFLRSLPPAWSNLAMTMRTKPDVATLSIDDLYNNLRVFEQELTSISKSSASAQNVAFVSHSKSNNNKVTWECPSNGTNDGKKRDSFYQDQGAGKKEQYQNCLLTMDDGVVNWGEHTVEEEETNHALMAISSNNEDHPHKNMEDRGIFDSGCSGHMTGNKDHLDDFEECKRRICYLWRFSWVFFLATNDETSGILQNFIRQIENQLNHRVKIIRSDNGTEFKNSDMLEFRGNKGIKQEYSNARTPQQNRTSCSYTPQQNGIAERKRRHLLNVARSLMFQEGIPLMYGKEPSLSQSPNDEEGDSSPEDGSAGAVPIQNERAVPLATQIEDNVTSEGEPVPTPTSKPNRGGRLKSKAKKTKKKNRHLRNKKEFDHPLKNMEDRGIFVVEWPQGTMTWFPSCVLSGASPFKIVYGKEPSLSQSPNDEEGDSSPEDACALERYLSNKRAVPTCKTQNRR